MRKNIIIDCDPGIDDALALAVAIANRDKLNILGICTVAGNQSIDKVTRNALTLVNFLGAPEIPVAMGSPAPLVRKSSPASAVHGTTGFGDTVLPEGENVIVSDNAVVFMRDTIMNLPEGEKVTLVPLGPLTNIALLLKVFPEVKDKIEEICLMGGSASGGNVTATAEFNIWHDPEAASIVFDSGVKVIMCGLDVTRICGFTKDHLSKLGEHPGKIQKVYYEFFDFYFKRPICEKKGMIAIHDATTVTYLLHPEWFEGETMKVTVDCSEVTNSGMTICDFKSTGDPSNTVTVLLKVDADKIAEHLWDTLMSY